MVIEEEKEEFARVGAELILAQAQEEGDLIRSCREADGLITSMPSSAEGP